MAALWATVNECATSTVGVRAYMPGDQDVDTGMFERFALEYRAASGVWGRLPGSSRTGWEEVGEGAGGLQGGDTWSLEPSAASLPVRGVVDYQWRLRPPFGGPEVVVFTATRTTSAGHPQAEEGTPEGFSAASCMV